MSLSSGKLTICVLELTPGSVFTQWMDKYFGQKYAKSFAYQILLALSTNLMGYGFAGLSRRFLVYPSFCLYPRSLVTIALNKALHNGESRFCNKKIWPTVCGFLHLLTVPLDNY